MTTIELIAGQLSGNLDFLKMTLADFSDADMLVRPVPQANHPLWQLGHITAGEVMMVNMIKPGAIPELPAGMTGRFDYKNTREDDPKKLGTKQELLDLFTRSRQATIAYVKTLKPEDLDKPTPEAMKAYAATVGDLLMVLVGHVLMHTGQIQVARRKLGKPVLF